MASEFLKKRNIILVLILVANTAAFSHDRFILPTHTTLSGDGEQNVSFISSISNDMFHPDRAFGDNGKGQVDPKLKGFFSMLESQIVFPNGDLKNENIWQAFTRFSAADLNLTGSGTYRIALVQPERLVTFFKKADGSTGRLTGPNPQLPDGATDKKSYLSSSRVETFVTLNKPTSAAVNPTGRGLELGGETHPNDLFVNEAAHFQLFYKGKPLSNAADVKVVLGNTRHRNQRNPISLKTKEDGTFDISFPDAGFYLLKANLVLPKDGNTDIDEKSAGLYVTLEVFPE